MIEIGCLSTILVDDFRTPVVLLSLSAAVIIFIILKRYEFSTRSRILLIYSHLTALFFPFVLYAMHIGCGIGCMPCQENIFHLISYALPTTLVASSLAGFVAIPMLYRFSSKRMVISSSQITDFVRTHSKRMGMRMPRLYATDDTRPVAFSFRSFMSAIFLSVGLQEIMSKKETEAIILHELAHIKQRSSILKLSDSLLRIFSPLSLLTRFHNDTSLDEKEADDFAISVQGTDRHILSAKRKMAEYESARKDMGI